MVVNGGFSGRDYKEWTILIDTLVLGLKLWQVKWLSSLFYFLGFDYMLLILA